MNFIYFITLLLVVLTYLTLVFHYGIYAIFSTLGNHVKWHNNVEKSRITIYVLLSLMICSTHFITTVKPLPIIYFDVFSKWVSFCFIVISCAMVLYHWRKSTNYYKLLQKRSLLVPTKILQKRSSVIKQESQKTIKKQNEDIANELINIQSFQEQSRELLNEVVMNIIPKVQHRKIDKLEHTDIVNNYNKLNGTCFIGTFEVFNKWLKNEELTESDVKLKWVFKNPQNRKNTISQISLIAFYDYYFEITETYHSEIKKDSRYNKNEFVTNLGERISQYFTINENSIELPVNILTNDKNSIDHHFKMYKNLLNS